MLTAYSRLNQNGIESLASYTEPYKDEKTSHWYFDDFRIAVSYHYHEKEKCSGVGVLTFAPNGLLWSQASEHCFNLDNYASICFAIDKGLDEAVKSKAKNITVFIPKLGLLPVFKSKAPYKEEPLNELHRKVGERLRSFAKYEIIERDDYPKETRSRLVKEAKEAAEPLIFDNRGRLQSSQGMIYFNVKPWTDEETRTFAEQYVRINMDFVKDYYEQYEADYGKEAVEKLTNDIKAKKIKKPPKLKKQKAIKEGIVRVKTLSTYKKPVICQACESSMSYEDSYQKYPEKKALFRYRCPRCLSTKLITETGRVYQYGRYPKMEKAIS